MKRRWLGLTGILIGMGTSVLMQTFMATSLPTIAKEFSNMDLYSWVFGAYMLASTVTIPLFGKLADLKGRRPLYMFGMIIFLMGSILASFSKNMQMLIAFRAFMGIGAGAIVPAALASIGDLFNEKEMAKIFGVVGITQVISNLIGPSLGGFITDTFSWRWGFIFFLPLGILSGILVSVGLPTSTTESNQINPQKCESNLMAIIRKLDWLGAILISIGLCFLVIGLQYVGGSKYLQGFGLVLLAGAVIYLSIVVEKKHPEPIFPIGLISQPQLLGTIVCTIILGIISNGSIAYIPLYFQEIYHISASNTGILLLPMMLAAGIGSGVSGRISLQKLSSVTKGVWLFQGLAFLAFVLCGAWGGKYFIMIASIPIGIGMGLLLPLFLSQAQNTADVSNRASIAGLIQLSRNLGGAIGVPLLGIWISGNQELNLGMQGIFGSLTFIACFGLGNTFWNQRLKQRGFQQDHQINT